MDLIVIFNRLQKTKEVIDQSHRVRIPSLILDDQMQSMQSLLIHINKEIIAIDDDPT